MKLTELAESSTSSNHLIRGYAAVFAKHIYRNISVSLIRTDRLCAKVVEIKLKYTHITRNIRPSVCHCPSRKIINYDSGNYTSKFVSSEQKGRKMFKFSAFLQIVSKSHSHILHDC